MTGRILLLLAALLVAGPVKAETLIEHPAECRVAQHLIENGIELPRVRKAIAAKRVSILVLGAGSSLLPGPNGPQNAYPAQLRAALAAKLPGVEFVLNTDVKARRTAVEMVKALPADVATSIPALVVWQTGTVDAMQGVDHDQFSHVLDKGINIAHEAGADVVLVNSQYSPRTESIIALGAYAESMRWVAVQHEIPLFDRFSIMKLWGDLGTFDLYSATKKLDMAERVHACIGRLLADLVAEAAKPEPPPGIGGR
jgi:hypothetical protein